MSSSISRFEAPAGLGPLWQALKVQPTDERHWAALAVLYAQRQLPWHHVYAMTQARRCAVARGIPLSMAPAGVEGDSAVWGDGDVLLSRSGPPWAGCLHVISLLETVLAEEPDDWLSSLYLVRCMELRRHSGLDIARVRDAVRRAIGAEPMAGETGHLLAQWRLRAGEPEQALAALRAVLLQAPQRHGSWLLQAQAQMQLGLRSDAMRSFEMAGKSQNPQLLALLAEKLFQFNFCGEALAVREAIARLCPNDANVWLQLAEIQSKLWQIEKAQASVARALELEPGNLQAQSCADDLMAAGQSRSQFERRLSDFEAHGLLENAQGAQRLLMQSLYQAHLSPEAVAELHRQVGQAMQTQALQSMPPHLPVPQPLPWNGQRRLRVGYVSGDLHRQHPVNVFMLPVLLRHDHARLEVFIYQTGTMIDEYTRQARDCADHWREAAHLSDLALRQLIVDDRIDVLVDLAGHTATHRLGVFASRPAPVQMSYLGYPHSTGLPCIDWMIGDAIVAPAEHAHLFTEKIARVSGTVFCWATVDEYALPPDESVPRVGPVVFGSFNNLLKMDDVTLAVWSRILCECPDSRLLLKSAVLADPTVRRHTLERFAAQGIGAERLDLRGPSELSLMMQEYLDVDVALDPFPYNGGTTSLQALWMGCPMVSLMGGNFVSRMGASFLTHLGRAEWLAQDVEEYVAKAKELAQQVRRTPWGRQAQRKAMRASDLCQIERHTREIEDIYLSAWSARMC